MYVTGGHSAVRGECVCTSLVGTVQYVVSVCVCLSLHLFVILAGSGGLERQKVPQQCTFRELVREL